MRPIVAGDSQHVPRTVEMERAIYGDARCATCWYYDKCPCECGCGWCHAKKRFVDADNMLAVTKCKRYEDG